MFYKSKLVDEDMYEEGVEELLRRIEGSMGTILFNKDTSYEKLSNGVKLIIKQVNMKESIAIITKANNIKAAMGKTCVMKNSMTQNGRSLEITFTLNG